MPAHTFVSAELSSAFDLTFSESGSWDYAALPGPRRNLSAISVAFWLQSADAENQGTPLSYATDAEPNAFTLTDYSGSVRSEGWASVRVVRLPLNTSFVSVQFDCFALDAATRFVHT